MTIIEIRPFRNGWQAYEVPGVQPAFLSQEQANVVRQTLSQIPARVRFCNHRALPFNFVSLVYAAEVFSNKLFCFRFYFGFHRTKISTPQCTKSGGQFEQIYARNLCKVLPDARNDIAQFSPVGLSASAFEPAVQKYANCCDLKVAVMKTSSDKKKWPLQRAATSRRFAG